ncbi:MAG: IMP dehydrogenase, partial [Nitrosopumilus sp.]|nr:IMP dehydrogenase [Nitrosopumilus sp.]
MHFKEGLTFDDVLLVPKRSPIVSRSQTSLKTKLSANIKINIPIISANMDSVTESDMASALAREGGIGIIHRFMTIEDQVKEVLRVKRSESVIIEQPYTIGPNNTIKEANTIMSEKGISGLLVEDNNKRLCGILTRRDIVFEKNLNTEVSSLMTKDVISAKVGTTTEQAKEILHKYKVEKLPIIDEEKKIFGLITGKDILKIEKYPNASKDKKGR